MANVELDVINISTQPAEQGVTNVKGRIKELKAAMVELELQGKSNTKEFQDMKTELGDLTRAMKRVGQDAAEASTTFSNNFANATKVIAGASAAVQTVTGLLGMMGVEMGEDSKLMKMLVSAMAVTSGVTAIQSGVEAFKLLTRSIKTTTIAQHGFNAALKANPIGAIVAVVAALVTGLISLVKWLDKSADSANALATESRKVVESLEPLKKAQDYAYRYAEACGKTQEQLRKLKREQLEYNIQLARTAYNQALQAKQTKATDEAVQAWQDAAKALKEAKQALVDYNNEVKISNAAAATKAREEADKARKERNQAALEAAKKRLEQLEKEKATVEEIKRANLELNKISGNITELDYVGELIDMAYDKLDAIKKADGQLKRISKDQIEAQKEYNELLVRWNELKKEQDETDKEDAKNKASKGIENQQLVNETEYTKLKNEIILKNEKDLNEQLYNLELQRIQNSKDLLDEKLKYEIITQEEYNNQYAKLELERTQLEQKEAKRREDAAKTETENKKLYNQAYYESLQSITSSVSSILGSAAELMDEESDEYKFTKAAEATISTLAGSIDAYMGMIKAIPGPWGIAAGVAAAASVLAQGMATVKQIYAVDKNKNNSSVSPTAITALSGSYSNVRLQSGNGGQYDLSDLGNQMKNQKVYVLQSDIDRSHDKRVKVRQNSTF